MDDDRRSRSGDGEQRDCLAANLANWDERAPAHEASPDYAVQRFLDDPSYISRVVAFDLPRLGDVRGARGVHLQCHIGTDTLSLARLGARMTGLDFSPAAIDAARRLAQGGGPHVEYVVADVHDAVDVLGAHRFDLVYTGVGALCWLPSIQRWAAVVAGLLAPGGRLFVREGHPMLWAVDDERTDDLLDLRYPYFERPEPVVYHAEGSYVETDATFTNTRTCVWNHGLGETVTALLAEGLHITGLDEHDSVPWEALPGLMVPTGDGEWRLRDEPWRMAHSFTLQAVRPDA